MEFLEKVEQSRKWPQQACTTMFFLIPKIVTSERPIALMSTLIRWWAAYGLEAEEELSTLATQYWAEGAWTGKMVYRTKRSLDETGSRSSDVETGKRSSDVRDP